MTPETIQTATALLTAGIPDPRERAELLAKLQGGAPREKWLTTAKAAAFAGCHRRTLLRWAKDGKLHPQRLTPSRIRWPKSELERFRFDGDGEG